MPERKSPMPGYGLLIEAAKSQIQAQRIVKQRARGVVVQGLARDYGLIACRDRDTGAWGAYLERHDDQPIPADKLAEIARLMGVEAPAAVPS